MKKNNTVPVFREGDTGDPRKINSAFDETIDLVNKNIESNRGKVIKKGEVITSSSSLDDVGEEQIFIEHNDTNKRALIKIEGKLYSLGSLTEV